MLCGYRNAECTVSSIEKAKVMACMYRFSLVANHQMSHVSKGKARLVYERVASAVCVLPTSWYVCM